MENTNPQVSVVTPFYNAGEYLAECIESVLAQTYSNYEYVIIDNCSTDMSAEIAKNYAGKDNRIKLIRNEKFLTQVQNYNHALTKISPDCEYFKIVQADDWIFPECLSRMVEVAEADASIGVVSAYSLLGSKIINDGLPYKKQTFFGRDVCRTSLLLDGKQIFGSPTTTLVRSKILNNREPFFDEKDVFEDTDVYYEILKTWNFGFSYQVLSFIRVENEGISSKISNFDPSWYLAKFIRVKKYGEIYLNADEYKQRLHSIKNIYFKYLAHNVFCRRGKEFWEFHRKGLASVNCELKISRLTKYISLEALDILFNPKAAVGRAVRTLRGSE